MSTKAFYWLSGLAILCTLGVGLAFYAQLPVQMATHWNEFGVVNGTTPKTSAILIMPIVMAILLGLFALIPKIDPLRNNIAVFRRQYNLFVLFLLLFFALVQVGITVKNLGVPFDLKQLIMPAVGLLLFAVAMILPKTKRNWFVGIRTPWTISSDVVWEKTHRLGATLFWILGIIAICAGFAPDAYMLPLFLVPLAVVVIWLIVYSYFVYQNQQH